MLSLRLKTIADLVDKDSVIADVGTDHAYLPIYLIKENIIKKAIASDISPKVIENAQKNVQKYHLEDQISLYISDGLKKIKENYNFLVIAGMGSSTIKKILSNQNLPNKIIIQSNNNLAELRKFMNQLNYKIVIERVIFDSRYYSIIKYTKQKEKLTEEEILFGKSNNIEYFSYLKEKYQQLYIKSKNKQFSYYIQVLNKIIEKRPD